MRELEDRDNTIHETRQQLEAAREEKRQCELELATVRRDVQSLMLQLQQKDSEIQRSRSLIR